MQLELALWTLWILSAVGWIAAIVVLIRVIWEWRNDAKIPEVHLGDNPPPPEERAFGVSAIIQVEKWDTATT